MLIQAAESSNHIAQQADNAALGVKPGNHHLRRTHGLRTYGVGQTKPVGTTSHTPFVQLARQPAAALSPLCRRAARTGSPCLSRPDLSLRVRPLQRLCRAAIPMHTVWVTGVPGAHKRSCLSEAVVAASQVSLYA